MTELEVLQAVRLKGRVDIAAVSETLGKTPDEVAGTVASLTDSGLLTAGKTMRISPDGRTRLLELLQQERSAIDTQAIAAAYSDFRSVNAEFKQLISDWQLKDGAPNSHDDAVYDAQVLARLDDVHSRAIPTIDAAATQVPRLTRYGDKLRSALDRVRAGETAWLTRPIIDSYHTVWFELHEELIEAAGLTREEEAAAGHA